MNLSGETRLVGVIGHPIGHSLSPRMHNASFTVSGLNYAYVPMDVEPGTLMAAVGGLRALGFRGFNVTLPHKQAIIPLLDELDATAELTGAVNTVTNEAGKLRGSNTDAGGFVEACREVGVRFPNTVVMMVGAGGAAAAIGAAVLGEGASELRIMNRTQRRAEALRDRLRAAFPERVVSVYVGDAEAVTAGTDAIINTTYLGMKDDDPLPVPARCFEPGMMVCDAVYRRGKETDFIRTARERGLRTASGERMLLYQGVQAQRMWTGREPAVAAMRVALTRDAHGGDAPTRDASAGQAADRDASS